MIGTYCNFVLYDNDNCNTLEEGDYVSEFSYWNDEQKITLKNVKIKLIRETRVTLVINDNDFITLYIGDIEGWS
jgi:hypothetical protein